MSKLEEVAAKMRGVLSHYTVTAVDDGNDYDEFNNEDVIEVIAEYDTLVEKTQGAWIVYMQDMTSEPIGDPFPLFLSMDELTARRYWADLQDVNAHTKFWIFGEEFGTR